MITRRYWTMTAVFAFITVGTVGRAGEEPPTPEEVRICLERVKEFHGGSGPWAVVGYRIGARAGRELELPRHDFRWRVVHRAPEEIQYRCVADGLSAATGATVGKLNLVVETVERSALETIVTDRRSGRSLRFRLRPELAATIADLPYDRLSAEGARVAALPDEAIFTLEPIAPQAEESPVKPE